MKTKSTTNKPAYRRWHHRLVRYVVAFRRSLTAYESDMGGWKERLQWELGFAEGEMGLPRRIDKYDHPYEHGYYVATH